MILIALLMASVVAQPADRRASSQTRHLLAALHRLPAKGYLFGHQDDLAYGVGWRADPGRSDVHDVAGDYPGLFGWDFSGLESGRPSDINGIPFDSIRSYVRWVYASGGVNTFTWHCPNPLGGTAWDTIPGTVASILPGGTHHALYVSWLERLGTFVRSLDGVPVLFRPFHELTGGWFWWGASHSDAATFKALWRFTRHYLNDSMGLHNILWVYNAGDNFSTLEGFMARYPGDDETDMVSFDTYQYNGGFASLIGRQLSVLDSAAAMTGKVEALAETGFEQVPDPHWWTGVLAPALAHHPVAYVMVWRNAGWNPYMKPPHMHYYAPYKGQASEDDFVRFYRMDNTLFLRDAAREKLYQ